MLIPIILHNKKDGVNGVARAQDAKNGTSLLAAPLGGRDSGLAGALFPPGEGNMV
jgi:hypothetical protein